MHRFGSRMVTSRKLDFFRNKIVYSHSNIFQTGTIFFKLSGYTSSSSKFSTYFQVSAEVGNALEENVPIVALESAIITHGMPFPTNIETALGIQSIIKRKGVVPATVGVIEGNVKVGLSDSEIEFLGSQAALGEKSSLVKISRRDFPIVISQKLSGGTTVAGTIIAASKAGIPIFATGGIGGVHREAQVTFDISCDLRELGRGPIAVVSAGVKSILDIGRTLEYLETEGVSVCVLRKGEDSESKDGKMLLPLLKVKFPAFFTAQSPFDSPWVLDNEIQAASMVHSALTFGLGSGILIALPIPKELEASGEVIEAAIVAAIDKAKAVGISGKEITPFILSEVNRRTDGASLKANQALIENNVTVASQIAIELSKIRNVKNFDTSSSLPLGRPTKVNSIVPQTTQVSQVRRKWLNGGVQKKVEEGVPPRGRCESSTRPLVIGKGRPVIIGGSSLDIVMAVKEDQIVADGRTHLGHIATAAGGVGRNVAEALKKLGHDPFLITTIGNDPFGKALIENFEACDMDTGGVQFCSASGNTAIYSAILNSTRECLYGIGDMRLHAQITPKFISTFTNEIRSAGIVLMDGNLEVEAMQRIMELCLEHNVPLWFEPTEVRKAQRLLEVSRDFWPSLSFMSPNLKELQSLLRSQYSEKVGTVVTGYKTRRGERSKAQEEEGIKSIASETFVQFTGLSLILLTRGIEGFMVAQCHSEESGKDQRSPSRLSLKSFPRPSILPAKIQSVSGAGDCLNAGFISGLLDGLTIEDCARKGTQCAADSLQSMHNVPIEFTKFNSSSNQTSQNVT